MRRLRFVFVTAILFYITPLSGGQQSCQVPSQFRGDFFSMERGENVDTLVNDVSLQAIKQGKVIFEGNCVQRWDDNTTYDADRNHDSKILFYDSASRCYQCFYLIYRTRNTNQYKLSSCVIGDGVPSLDEVCSDITDSSELLTYFRKTLAIINCKNTFEGVYQFSYEWDTGGGGICNSENSQIVACQEPGSPYVDNQVFVMEFAKCPQVSSSVNDQIRFQCMGTWMDEHENIWSTMADLGEEDPRFRFRCMLTRSDQQEPDNRKRYTMSWWADCGVLKSPYEGPIRLIMTPVIGSYMKTYIEPSCIFPANYSGHWYHISEYVVKVDINRTHIYFKSLYDQFSYRESYFVCVMTSGTRYMVLAVTVGKCEVDFVCFDLLPRHHNIVRWRMGRPYRMTSNLDELDSLDYKIKMFRQTCSWSSFTIDRTQVNWNYRTFLLDPPVPVSCPLRGRYTFSQQGDSEELYRTRIRGITERPRHNINCDHMVTEWKSCDESPFRIQVDAEYCETVDHVGKPVGQYDMPDWEMTCIGSWDEDYKSYLITWDPEDARSAFRCWVYERLDWLHVRMSKSANAACKSTQRPTSYTAEEGAAIALDMWESERLFDSCAMKYKDGSPWNDVEEGLEPQWQDINPVQKTDFRQVKSRTYSSAPLNSAHQPVVFVTGVLLVVLMVLL